MHLGRIYPLCHGLAPAFPHLTLLLLMLYAPATQVRPLVYLTHATP
jgi:hypothetical protein